MDAIELFGQGPQLRYTVPRDEFLGACTESALRSEVSRRRLATSRFVTLAIVSMGALWTGMEAYSLGVVAVGVVLLIWTTIAGGLILLTTFSFRRCLTKNYRDFADLGLFDGQIGEHRLILAEQGVVEQNDRGMVLIRWPYITGLESMEHSLRLLAGPVQFFFVPRTAFPDDAALQQFEATVQRKMQEAKENRDVPGDS